ncbi:hypothetical protein LWI28_000265 [Acer negundo]|uniref:AAA+ ATPase domain-containing protein n=1 Tax=Acer negundo TaxID=4023 RepID=A0AAD5IK37_ACENE|nr:hypothetical protein LWI28_000265 [Acer negundo]
MFSMKDVPSTTSVLSTYTAFTATAMLVKTVINEVQSVTNQIIPKQFQDMILSKFGGLCGNGSRMTLTIDEFNGYSINQLYEASEIYLRTKINPSLNSLKVSKSPKENNFSLTINKGEKIVDVFEGVQLLWVMASEKTEEMPQNGKFEKRLIELSFHKKYMEKVLSSYLRYVMERSNAWKEENKVVKLYALGHFGGDSDGGGAGAWGSTNLDHPATFDKIAMDPVVKQALIDDLDRFVRRRDFYRRVGKAWKRGYLLYGPPGTGKSSLIAAMANYLKFSIYDLELASIYCNSELRRLLVSTSNRSILVIEDIDCSIELQNRQSGEYEPNESSQLTLSGLLNFIDGLWSSCGDERVIVFTTNHKERLDSALLRPGRMDMHIHMSYCTPSGFRTLVSNYLGININDHHNLFPEIDELMTEVQVTPAEIAEELMKNEDADIALEGLIKFLKRKKIEIIEDEAQVGDNKRKSMSETEDGDEDEDDQHIIINNCKTKRMRSKMKMSGFVKSEIRQRSEVCRTPWHRPRGTNRGAYRGQFQRCNRGGSMIRKL